MAAHGEAPAWRVVTDGLVFPEAPRWHAGRIWLSDIHGHRVCRIDPDGGPLETVVALEGRPSGIGFLPDGTLLIVSMVDRRLLTFDGSALRPYADLRGLCDGFLNDMAVDARGHAYVGARNPALGPGHDAVIHVAPGGAAEVATAGMHSPNGSAVIDEGAVLVVAETSASRLSAFDIGSDGVLSGRRIHAEVPGDHPDGICADAEGGIWFGSPGAGEFVRVVPGTGVTDRLSTPGRWAVACVLGGADRRTLVGITGRNSVANIERVFPDPALDVTSDAAGWVEAVDVEVPGVGIP